MIGEPKHYVDEVGTELILDVGVLIGTVNDQYIKFLKPTGVTGSFDAEVFSSFSQLAEATGTYLLKHDLELGDFDTPGDWVFQAFVAAIDGTWVGESVILTVFDAFQ